MIISKTPYRLSFFGGGTDYPSWLNNNDGIVMSTTINKFIYISLNTKPSMFHKEYRLVYKHIENKKKIRQIKHPSIRECLNYFKVKPGVELFYMGDLPARSGLGSSSAFTVGLLNCLNALKKNKISKKKLAEEAIFIEQKVLRENVGSQDQISTSFGGFNIIKFKKNNFSVNQIKMTNNLLNELNKNLVLCYSGIPRIANDIVKNYIRKLSSNQLQNVMKETFDLVNSGNSLLKKGNLDEFGKLLNVSWHLKKSLHSTVSNTKLDNFYNQAISNGALGGKLLGAGGGGFFLFYVPKIKIKKFKRSFKSLYFCDFKFENKGSSIINNSN